MPCRCLSRESELRARDISSAPLIMAPLLYYFWYIIFIILLLFRAPGANTIYATDIIWYIYAKERHYYFCCRRYYYIWYMSRRICTEYAERPQAKHMPEKTRAEFSDETWRYLPWYAKHTARRHLHSTNRPHHPSPPAPRHYCFLPMFFDADDVLMLFYFIDIYCSMPFERERDIARRHTNAMSPPRETRYATIRHNTMLLLFEMPAHVAAAAAAGR